MQVAKQHVDIVLPAGLSEASASNLLLCELFIGRLLDSELNPIDVRVNPSSRAVECGDRGVRDAVGLLVGSGKASGFASQLQALLHPAEDERLLGKLVCTVKGTPRKFALERLGSGEIDWRITRE